MHFKDRHYCYFEAGGGGHGAMHFYRDKEIAYGGPDGGNGGNGGDIWISASNRKSSLHGLKSEYGGIRGGNGGGGFEGKNGLPTIVEVPVGTIIKNQNGEIIADLSEENAEFMITAGGAGGLGNAFFKSDTNTVPRQSTPGNDGERTFVELELRKISDFGLVGLPNSGKSSLLNNLSDSKSDVSMIPGTTLVPHIGHLVYNDNTKLLLADLPGIEPKEIPYYFNTSQRAGQFLQHCSRSKSLLYVIDGDPNVLFSPLEQFNIIRKHLTEYDIEIEREIREIQLSRSEHANRFQNYNFDHQLNTNLADVPFVVTVTKSDLNIDRLSIEELNVALRPFHNLNLYYPKVIETSAVDYNGWSILIYILRHMYETLSGNDEINDIYW